MTRNDTSGLDTGAEYRPEVDGLRAIALVSVIILHLNAAWLPGGFADVDVFFVISGYLMTRIIRGDIESGRFSFARFWARRIRRIYPALLVVVVAVLMVQHYLGFRPDEAIVGRHAVAAIASYSNVYLWREDANYWGTNAAAFYLLPTRAAELGFGAAAALWDRAPNAAAARGDGTHRPPPEHGWEHRWPRLRGLLANAGLAAIVWAMTSLANFGFRLLIPVLGAVLLLTCGQSGSVARMLGWRPPCTSAGFPIRSTCGTGPCFVSGRTSGGRFLGSACHSLRTAWHRPRTCASNRRPVGARWSC